jgi:hypothetical protein
VGVAARISLIAATAVVVTSAAACAHPGPGTTADAPPSSASDSEGRSVANYFKVGDCIADPIAGATSVRLVTCANPHAAEVYAILALPDGPFPGNDSSAYKPMCAEQVRAYADPALLNDPGLRTDIRYPDADSWKMGDRSVTCIASSGTPRTGSIRKAG